MRASIRDLGVLLAIRPLDVVGFLHANGWTIASERGRSVQIWVRDDKYEVLVPFDRKLDGFAVLMAELLATLEVVHGRTQASLISDMRDGSVDKVRVRVDDDDLADGTIPVEVGSSVVSSARHMIWSAASSAAEPRSNYPRRRPKAATDYLRRVRLGQTEVGSFTVSVLCPVPPAPLHTSMLHDFGVGSGSDPFERQVTKKLMQGLDTASRLAVNFVHLGTIEALSELAHKGVSANLCDSLLRARDAVSSSGQLHVTTSWSWRRPVRDAIRDAVVFSPDDFDLIEEASRILKEFSPREEHELVGTVIRLERGDQEFDGRITIRTFFDGGSKSVGVRLSEDPYKRAMQAHEDRSLVACLGDLVKDGNRYELVNPRVFRVLSDV